MFTVLIVSLFAFCQISAQRECDIYHEFQCVDKHCVARQQWCDGWKDCPDGSDEYFCNGNIACMENYFTCKNGRCIPRSGLCDGTNDCKDGSDEECSYAPGGPVPVVDSHPDDYTPYELPVLSAHTREGDYASYELPVLSEHIHGNYSSTVKEAVAAAAKYLLSERHSDYGWGGAIPTSRAIVALAFTERVQKIDKHEMKLMKKYLNIQLSLDLIPSSQETSLCHLSLFINALYATCQDPRNFQGMDLVNLLLSKTEISMNSNFGFPLVLLTLCIANENIDSYGSQLKTMYSASGDISSKALAMMAMVCMKNKTRHNFNSESRDFLSKLDNLKDVKSDVYTKALLMQASNAMKHRIDLSELLSYQQENGSFGDLLATYYAIPALLKTSLLQLKCKHTEQYEGISGKPFAKPDSEIKVKYSLWMAPDIEADTHSMVIAYEGNKSFYDIMRIAASRDKTYSFMVEDGKKVYGVADIPNDVETGMYWTLYRSDTDMVSRNSKDDLREENKGVEQIFPKDKDHFIFWLKRS